MKKVLFALFIWLLAYCSAYAGSTTILSTTTYSAATSTHNAKVALPEVGYYIFDVVATSSGTKQNWALALYLQNQGVAGGDWYTMFNSTITACNDDCTRFIVPDVYMGGYVRAVYSMTTGSVTIKVVGREVNP